MHTSALTLAADGRMTEPGAWAEGLALEQRAALDRFLAGVERRAFRMALFTVRDTDDALDIVQDAMVRLVRQYGGAPAAEWRTLFYRILRTCILDHHRRRSVRQRLLTWWQQPADGNDQEDDPIASVAGPDSAVPDKHVALGDAMAALDAAVRSLPVRQQEAFLLRTLEGLDVAETAAVMGCSEGSVKTHYSRAVHRLRAALGDHWP
jgi:RNA polymerase sigma-70 factor (ECF subfamily)